MKCWKCGREISDGTTECVFCHADQRRSVPQSDVGWALRQLYDHYGAEAVLTNNVLLVNGIGDVITDSINNNIKRLKNQLRMAMDAGLGHIYLYQIAIGKPDQVFDERVKKILIEDAGLNDDAASDLMKYFDEMVGWRISAGKADSNSSRISFQSDSSPAANFVGDDLLRKEHLYRIEEPTPGNNQKQKSPPKKIKIVIIIFAAIVLFISLCLIFYMLFSSINFNSDTVNRTNNTLLEDKNAQTISGQSKVTPTPKHFYSVGQTVTFGHYEQDNNPNNGKEPIEWIVLSKDNGTGLVLLISKYGLDIQPIWENAAGRGLSAPNWDNSRLRNWLNGEFYYSAFNQDERDKFAVSRNINPENEYEGWSGGLTLDHVFVFTPQEVEQYMTSRTDRITKPSPYCAALGADMESSGNASWWLRPGKISTEFREYSILWDYIGADGLVKRFFKDGFTYDTSSAESWNKVINTNIMVRPAIWIWQD